MPRSGPDIKVIHAVFGGYQSIGEGVDALYARVCVQSTVGSPRGGTKYAIGYIEQHYKSVGNLYLVAIVVLASAIRILFFKMYADHSIYRISAK